MSTGIHIQNVGSNSTTITITYYRADGGQQCTRSATNIARYAAALFYDTDGSCPGANFLGSAVATASQPLVGRANEASADGRLKKGYSAFQIGTGKAYAPLVYGTYRTSTYVWDSPIIVQNFNSSSSANVTVNYYNTNGSFATSQSATLNPRGSIVFTVPLSNFRGSASITANQNIAAIVHVKNDSLSGDTHAMYNASNR